MKKQVIFVDDEINILNALKRALRNQRHEWDMSFVSSGAAALDMAKNQHIDAIITDMRMPGMDGAELLQQFKKIHPDAVRIFLSGQSEQELTLKSVMLAHRYMNKPCEIDELKRVINQGFTNQNRIQNEQLVGLVSAMENLPSLPSLYVELITLLKDPDVNLADVVKTVKKDPAMTSKILQLVNSAFFCIGRHISSAGDAISLLGLEILKGLVLSIGIFSQYENGTETDFSMEKLSNHSLAVANLAKKIAEQEKCAKEMVDGAFTAGLLHDMGKLILIQNLPEKYADILEQHVKSEIELIDVEMQILGATHGEVGAALFGLWGLPEDIVEAVANHHTPSNSAVQEFSILTIVHAANAIIKAQHQNLAEPEVDNAYLKSMDMGSHLSAWQDLALE